LVKSDFERSIRLNGESKKINEDQIEIKGQIEKPVGQKEITSDQRSTLPGCGHLPHPDHKSMEKITDLRLC